MPMALMPDLDDNAAALRQRLRAISVPPSADERAELQQRVHDFVDELRASGHAPEHVIVAVKKIARSAGFRRFRVRAPSVRAEARDQLLTDIVDWSVKRYFV